MINDPNMIEELMKKLDEAPEDIIKSAINEGLEEDKQEYIEELLKDNSNNYDLNVNINYYLTTEYNLYVHKHETSSIKRFFKIEKNEYEDEEVEVA